MNENLRFDPVMRPLADLPPITSDAAHDRRVISRCHAVMARQTRSRVRAQRVRTSLANTLDMVWATAVVFYATIALSEGARLALTTLRR